VSEGRRARMGRLLEDWDLYQSKGSAEATLK
jgi:hypothetical protein